MPVPATRSESETQLWAKLVGYSFDAVGVQRPVSIRLAEEQRWTAEYTGRVLEEYRRYLFLTAVAGHTVCPSEDVDQAWHEHLTWTRQYWDELCGKVLGRPLHHDPSGGGPRELWRHWEMYERTLASYERVFGEKPPGDIWPAPERRFAKPRATWRERVRRWVKPAHGLVRQMAGRPAVVVVLLPVLAAGAGPFDFDGPTFLKFYVPFALGAVALSLVLRYGLRIGDCPLSGDDLTAAEAACVSYGPRAAVNATIAGLIQDGHLTTDRAPKRLLGSDPPMYRAAGDLPEDADAIGALVLQSASELPRRLEELHLAARPESEKLVEDLTERGYLVDDTEAFTTRLWPGVVLGAVLVVGLVKVAVGLWRDRAVGFLVVICMGLVMVALFCLRRPWRTGAARDALNGLKEQHPQFRRKEAELSGVTLAMLVGLYGATVLHGETFKHLRKGWKEMSAGSGDGCSSFGSGCGGGGCGGGGGGCGGCSS